MGQLLPDLLHTVCHLLVQDGHLVVQIPGRPPRAYGRLDQPPIVVEIADHSTAQAIAIDPNRALGEAYMAGQLQMLQGSIYDLVALLMRNAATVPAPWWIRNLDKARFALRRTTQMNGFARARRNIAHHYDIEDEIYDLFLDSDRQYSCAYFQDGGDLHAAQRQKMRHITAKLLLDRNRRVLDIGSGWGGLACYIAQQTGAEVTGVTLSRAQLREARVRARKDGITANVRFEFEDYRELTGKFDRIVSVGMLEHVGVANYSAYFARVRDLLPEDGIALVHSIGRSDGPGFTNPFISRYIFPGGYFPSLSEILPMIEHSGLIITDVEILRLHYAETLKAWRERFRSRWAEAVARKGETFCRMWEFYLAGSEAAFRYQGLIVFQIQLARRIDTVPLTRDYIGEAEVMLAAREATRQTRASA